MAYSGSGPADCDFALNTVGVCILGIKEKMMDGIAAVLEKAYPEQGIVASIVLLRILGERFPKSVSAHFTKQDFEFVVHAFDEWVAKVKIPRKHREALIAEARREFALFEERILKPAE